MRKLTTEIVIQQFIKIHGNRYDYSLVEYIDAKIAIITKCNICGFVNAERIDHHKDRKKCSNCKKLEIEDKKQIKQREKEKQIKQIEDKNKIKQREKEIKIQKKNKQIEKEIALETKIQKSNYNLTTLQEFIEISVKKHGNKYEYSSVVYNGNKTKIKIFCKACNDYFYQLPANHYKCGCDKCSRRNHNPKNGADRYKNRKTTLYYIKVDNVYKIGVTLTSVKRRFRSDKNVKIEILKAWVFEDGLIAYNYEQHILKTFNVYQYKGKKILIGGNTELFNKNILPLFEDKIIV